MLAHVKKLHTDIDITGPGAGTLLKLIQRHYRVEVRIPESSENIAEEDETTDVFATDWWKKNSCRILAGYRHKHEMSQEELAEKSGICQSVISEYESGKRRITMRAAVKLGRALGEKPEKLVSE